MPWKVSWEVWVDGLNVSAKMRPYLIDIEIMDKDGSASDTCSLTLDDTDGQVRLPKDGAFVEVWLQGVLKFSGTVDSVRSSGSRGGGRTLKVSAKGFDSRGKVKEPLSFHKDDASLKDFLAAAGSKAGIAAIEIDPAFASIQRDYWSAEGESLIHLGQRLAREIGGTFKIRGDKAVLAKRGQGQAPGGAALPVVIGTVGGNLISWDISPFRGRRSFTKAKVRYFDRKSASFKTEEVEYELDRDLPESTNAVRATVKDEAQARQVGDARKREAEREGGEGNVELDLAVDAQAEASFILTGARPGVDGTYRIASVRHRADRSGGSTTSLEVKQPSAGAGKDSR
ncbi:late control D family protein [Phyllobacterium phragmitis]|uniref:Late control D family protein n=1 Tax=Phyllobacterium phragmitis TaxID=2670329 RepID=A0A2S9IK07_9HYPH|nr:late control D family protein [Phyllobacterium phragmitis]PRD40864.1 late control D family protein [Phyllobacterium phragmitis]